MVSCLFLKKTASWGFYLRFLAAISGAVNAHDPSTTIGSEWFFMMIYCDQF
jgi:hypothetical protein